MKYKKSLLFLCLIIAAICTINVFTFKSYVYADTNPQIMIVTGECKEEAAADLAILNFNINVSSEKYDEGKSKINKIYEDISASIKSLDPANEISLGYSSCYTNRCGQIDCFDFCYNVNVTSKNVSAAADLIDVVQTNSNINYYGTTYALKDNKQIYSKALKAATEDAKVKAAALSPNASIKMILETSVYSYSNASSKIIVEARVKAVFCEEQTTLKNDNDNAKL